ncbi:hypothetical protein [Pseudodesulfovibrio indicus]|uniref:hypothetical protein n=1 Tax=Pseudodesulfovibrio indicus TaxID=1716143 RepID=UPI00292D52FE|nr:hypothetical protein [Pseudodesulfovibrio indicus]
MRFFSIIATLLLTVVLLTPGLGAAQSKFPNKDTAKNRQDNGFGTRPVEDGDAVTTFGTNERGDTTIDSHQPKQEEVDWYDKVIIAVDPDVSWPSKRSTTTTTKSTDPAGNTSTSTTTTTTE